VRRGSGAEARRAEERGREAGRERGVKDGEREIVRERQPEKSVFEHDESIVPQVKHQP
jgi:hypothetical protein